MTIPYALTDALPFVSVLLSISVVPLLAHDFWENHQNKIFIVLGLWAMGVIINNEDVVCALHTIGHTLYSDYIPFMLTIGTLYLISTAMKINLSLKPSTGVLVIFLMCGALLASVIGTTGASILLIYPLIDLIWQRKRKTHIIIFFIFLVSNCGGALSPLGDPPLFMGYLRGVPFLWPLQNLWSSYILTNGLLLVIFAIWDKLIVSKEAALPHIAHRHFSIQHSVHLFWLGLTIVIVFLGHPLLTILGLTAICGLNLYYRKLPVHWAPITEVAKVFAVIFMALIPVVGLLQGDCHPCVSALKNLANPSGIPDPLRYFWLSGIFSAFLDNAPTYLLFFNMASGQADVLIEKSPHILKAISLGSIFMGALTYIGNAPNLMVRSIAKDSHIHMPSFIGYMGYTCCILLPVLSIISFFL